MILFLDSINFVKNLYKLDSSIFYWQYYKCIIYILKIYNW